MSQEHPKRGTKFDQTKPDLSLLPKAGLFETAKALTFGAQKYGRHNFKEGIAISRLTAAAMRHITQFNDGEDKDEETQCIHLGNACANLFMALDMLVNKPEMDDRYKKIKEYDLNKLMLNTLTITDDGQDKFFIPAGYKLVKKESKDD